MTHRRRSTGKGTGKRRGRIRRGTALFLLAFLLFFCPRVRGAERWRELSCPENRPGCLLLQMAFMGCFERPEEEDSLSLRVLSAAYGRLLEVTQEDAEHFSREFSLEEEETWDSLYEALGSCLYADIEVQILAGEELSPARRVLLLFLDPSEPEAEEQMEYIRGHLSSEVIEKMAEEVGSTGDFVEWVLGTSFEAEEEAKEKD